MSGGGGLRSPFTVPKRSIKGALTKIVGMLKTKIGVMDSTAQGIEVRWKESPMRL